MLVRKLNEAVSFVAGDGSILKEIIHPDKQAVKLGYSMAWATVKKETYPHTLQYSEVYHIIKGRGRMHIDDEIRDVVATDTVYIPADSVQYIENTGETELEFLCIVDPAWQPEIETVVKNCH
jgi:mannose-6-phosphate isomerase-like protein (cupin superfamily)